MFVKKSLEPIRAGHYVESMSAERVAIFKRERFTAFLVASFTLFLAAVLVLTIGLASVPVAHSETNGLPPAQQTDTPSPPIANSRVLSLFQFQGNWRRTNSEQHESARISSIEEAIDGLTWVVRKMAGGVLRSTTKPPEEVQFVWDGSALHQRIDGSNGTFTRPVALGAGPVEAIDDRGDPFFSSWKMGDDGLSLNWEQHQAHGRNIYRLKPDGQTLEIEHTIQVTALSGVAPIVYRSQFKRSPSSSPPAVSAPPAH